MLPVALISGDIALAWPAASGPAVLAMRKPLAVPELSVWLAQVKHAARDRATRSAPVDDRAGPVAQASGRAGPPTSAGAA
jgi:hypothetical protein